MNVVVLKGRLVADPELRQTPSNVSVCRFKVAVDKYAKAGEERKADFIPCTAWRGTAEFVSKYFNKGQEIIVNGSIHNNDFTDKDGVKHYSFDVTAESVEFCGGKNSGTPSSDQTVDIGDLGGFEEILSDGDVPF